MLCVLGVDRFAATYDDSGFNNYTDLVNDAVNNFNQAAIVAGTEAFSLRPPPLIAVNQANDY